MLYPKFLTEQLPILDQDKKYYVYFLVDPRTNKPFYVGKGYGKRCYVHFKETKEKNSNIYKFNKIQKIQSLGYTVPIHYIKQLLDQDSAYAIETKLIKFWGRKGFDSNGILTNICEDNRPPSKKEIPKSKDQKEKLSKALKDKSHVDLFGEEKAKRMSIEKSVRQAGKKRKPFSKIWRDNMSKAQKKNLKDSEKKLWFNKKTGLLIYCTRIDLRNQFSNLCICYLKYVKEGKLKQHKGWSIINII